VILAFELKKPYRLWHVLKDILAAAEAKAHDAADIDADDTTSNEVCVHTLCIAFMRSCYM
jgi:hypothetical protein